MVKNNGRSVNGAALFGEVSGALMGMTHQQLAEALDCTVVSLRSALRDANSASFRNPPAGWEVTLRRLLQDRVNHFANLAKQLNQPE